MDGTQDKPADGEEQNVTERVSRKTKEMLSFAYACQPTRIALSEV